MFAATRIYNCVLVYLLSSVAVCTLTVQLSHQGSKIPQSTFQYEDRTRRNIFVLHRF